MNAPAPAQLAVACLNALRAHLVSSFLTPLRLLSLLGASALSAVAADRLVVVQAESGTLGSDFVTATAGGVTYITAGTDFAGTAAPTVAAKVATYSVTFPQAGTYNLYARVRVGPAGGADESYYYGNGFGTKAPGDAAAWIVVNNNPTAGYTAPTDVVLGAGTIGSGAFKWIRLSGFNFSEPGPTFVVPAGSLTQTFQLGTRENGLDIDQFAFGLVGNNFTVANLLSSRPVIPAAQVFTAYENPVNGDVIGQVLATDTDVPTTFQGWTITGGTGVGVFAINAATGVLSIADASAINPVTTPSYTLTLTVDDGIYTSIAETVTVNVSALDSIAVIGQPAAGVYKSGDNLSFVVALNSPMTVTGEPRLALAVGSQTRYATYASGSGSNRLTFTLTIPPGDDDPDGIAVLSPLELNGGTITDGTSADVALIFTPPNTSGIRVDSTPPAAPVVTGYVNASRTVSGTAEASSTVRVYLDGVLAGTTTASAVGNWSVVINISAYPAGTTAVAVTTTATDTVGNLGELSPPFPIEIVIDPNVAVIVQAESGTRGSDYNQATAAGATFISPATNYLGDDGVIGGAGASRPNTANKVASYTVTFPQGGTYDLYVRVRVGAGGGNDDSMYYGNGFGAKNPSSANDWIIVNQLSGIGFTGNDEWVTSQGSLWGGGGAANNVFKWIKLSGADLGEPSVQFIVPADARTQTFQIGSREDGLDVDQLAFALSGLHFTVANLNGGQPGTSVLPPAPFDPTHPPMATGKGKFLGGAWSTAQAPNFDNYFNQLTPENAGKWGSVEAVRDVMNWTELDTAYNLAKANGWPFRFHILVWGNQQPAWIETLPPAEQLEEINEWYAAVAARYPAIDYLEVVNEPLHDPPNSPGGGGGNYFNALGGSNGLYGTGWDWIVKAFELARQYFPTTPLVLNEYSVENDGNLMPQYINIVNILKARGLIDVVGVQGHAFSLTVPNTTLLNNINNLANSTGLPIQITELDIDGVVETNQAAEYARVFPVFWEHPSIMGITLWGYRPGHWRAAQGAAIVRANGSEEPSMLWLKDYVGASDPQLRPFIIMNPADQAKLVHQTATFTAKVIGHPAPAVQWQWSSDGGATWQDAVDDGVTFSGATTATLTVHDVAAVFDGVLFHVVATNVLGTKTSADAELSVTKLAATPALVDLELEQTYDGAAKTLTVTTNPPGLPVIVTYNGSTTPPTAAGTYTVVATIDSPDYAGSVTDTLVIVPAVGALAFVDLTQSYDGTPRLAGVTTAPAGGNVAVTYNGSPTAPTLPGTYEVVATIDDPNFVPGTTASGTLQVSITALLRRSPVMNGDIDGSMQVLTPVNVTLNGSASITGDLLLPGTPTVQLNGSPLYGGAIDATGAAGPISHQLTLNGGAALGRLVRRVDAIAMPTVAAPSAPTGTRSVILNNANQSAGDFGTLRDLTVQMTAGIVAVPPGAYGRFVANGANALTSPPNGFTLGIAGATEPSVYHFQSLAMGGTSVIRIVGPVVITVNDTFIMNNGVVGTSAHPEWLQLRVARGGVTLNVSARLDGYVTAPSGTVIINGNSRIHGEVVADSLTLNGNGLLEQAQ